MAILMTRKEAIRRLRMLALKDGHKENHYVKRALVEFLERREELVQGPQRTQVNGFHTGVVDISHRVSRYPN
jgi:DNA gyrase/topoisomerase IV subunit A